MFSNLSKKISSKVLRCPRCQQKIRVPIRPGKTLEVRCQSCGLTFQLNFQSPFRQVFKWDKRLSIGRNLREMFRSFKRLPQKARLAFIAQMLMIVFMVMMLLSITQKLLK